MWGFLPIDLHASVLRNSGKKWKKAAKLGSRDGTLLQIIPRLADLNVSTNPMLSLFFMFPSLCAYYEILFYQKSIVYVCVCVGILRVSGDSKQPLSKVCI